jgi:2-(1,2-epoxy-1,2-dihydrophenyl)acetyl-CoA isomerase
MTESVLLTSIKAPVATLTLNRPKQFNALNGELRAALQEAIREIEANESVRVVILKGEGRGFCAGADLASGLEHPVSKHLEEAYKPSLLGIAESSKLWIAQVHGSAAGIGAAFAMNCDFVTMAEDASIYMAFAAISLVPDGGNTKLLLDAMGYHRALQAIVEGRKIPANECLATGIANLIAPAGNLDAMTMDWAKDLASRAPLATAAAKRLLRAAGGLSFAEAFDAEGKEQDPLTMSHDFATGVKAFFDKRKPIFEGK